MTRILDELGKIAQTTTSVDLKIHKRYTEDDLTLAREEITTQISEADKLYQSLIENESIDGSSEVANNDKIYKTISEQCKLLDALKTQTNSNPTEKRQKEGECYEELFDCYNDLRYSFRTARKETKNFINNSSSIESTGSILLCKNVRIMEDLINKICSNNIDKSIIAGEQHFDSIQYGFEWLFCHKDLSDSNAEKQLDIRDCNRYLDYIKYQIMVASKYAEASPKASTEIDLFFDKIRSVFEKEDTKSRAKRIDAFKSNVKQLIEDFFTVYELLIKYRDALLREEEIRKSLTKPIVDAKVKFTSISINIINLSSVAVRVLLDRFVSFVKISDLNFGYSTFNRTWFNYSELSKSNYAGSNFKYARIENAKMKDCDISTCNFVLADGGRTDFSGSNFNYSNLSGINLVDAIVNHCEFQNAMFMDADINYKDAIRTAINEYKGDDNDLANKRARMLTAAWSADNADSSPIDSAIQFIIKDFQELEPALLDINSRPEKPWNILEYANHAEELRNISFKMRNIIWGVLEKCISAELLQYAKDLFSFQKRSKKKAKTSHSVKILLDAANLTNISAKYTQLGGNDLSHIIMSRSSFENADLSGVTMYYTLANAASFIYCNINQAECFESDFRLANFSSAVLNNALFLNCDLNHTNWSKSIIVGTVFADFSFYIEENIGKEQDKELNLQINQNIKFYGNDRAIIGDRPVYEDLSPFQNQGCPKEFRKFWRHNCSVNDATFTDSLADRAVFLNIIADRSTFNRVSFKNAFWANCRTYLSDFIGTDFRYSSILFCCMGQSNFTKANLTNTIVRYVDFNNCNLSFALFNSSKIDHALFENADLQSLNFSGATITSSAFENCKFLEVIISGATFKNCIFAHVDFGVLYGFHSSQFQNCYFSKCTFNENNIDDGIVDLLKQFGDTD